MNKGWPYKTSIRQAWSPSKARIDLMSVPIPQGLSKMNSRQYLDALTDRVEWLVQQEDNPQQAMIEAVSLIEEARMSNPGIRTDNPMAFSMDLMDNLELKTRLSLLGAPAKATPVSSHPEAVKSMIGIGLLDWIREATYQPRPE